MKAVVHQRYGEPEEVLSVEDVEIPTVGDDEVLVRVMATSVHADIWHVVTGRPWVLRAMGSGLLGPKPAIPGTDLAGFVEAVGAKVGRFAVGDAVFGESATTMQWKNGGAYAQYAAAPEGALAIKPDNVSFAQAASVATAGYIVFANLLDSAAVQEGQHVLVNGAAGAVGSVTVQHAKAVGAVVTAVDCAEKRALLTDLGADHIIDYRRADVTEGAHHFDLIVDVASTLPLKACKRILTDTGIYLRIGHDHYGAVGSKMFGGLPGFFALVLRSIFDRHLPDLQFSMPAKHAIMQTLADMMAAGTLTPHIAATYPLDDIAPALQHLQRGTALGWIVLEPN